MLHHFSVAVNDPKHVAEVMAEIFKGYVGPFPPNPGSYMALAGDEHGTMIEFYPAGTELVPGNYEGQVGFTLTPNVAQFTSFHAAISVPTTLEEIERIGAREGWYVLPASRDGLFEVVEFWVENRLMLELLTPTMAAKYLEFLKPSHLREILDQFSLVEARR